MILTERNSIDRSVAPKIVDAVDFNLHLKPYKKLILSNGVEVYTINASAEEVMMVEWVYYAGDCYEEKNLVAATANFLLKNGTSGKSAFQLNEHFEYYGAYLNRAAYNETSTITLHTLTRHIDKLLPVVREMLIDSVFPEGELTTCKKIMQQRLSVNLMKSDFVAHRLIDAYLYGEQHPYGKFSRFEDYEALTRERLFEFYERYYLKGKFIMFVAGKLPDNLEELLNKNFGNLSNGMIEPLNYKREPAKEKKQRIINDPNGVQGAIRIARPFPNRHHPDFLKVQVLNILFGGFFGSRLMSNIREDKGYTYGIQSYLQNHVHESAWMISTEAGRDVCEPTIKEIYHEMQVLREDLIDEEELLLVRNYMMGSILGDLDGPFQVIARWKNIILNDLNEKYFYDSIQNIKTVTAEELKQLAEKYLDPKEFYELLVV
ncbi:MAG TPA: pitrilysin family protein [Chitinophagaceae bacterium]|nr:pitrilysin family protein [Chitinophagaceae bacterium]